MLARSPVTPLFFKQRLMRCITTSNMIWILRKRLAKTEEARIHSWAGASLAGSDVKSMQLSHQISAMKVAIPR
jgi:hypothetical protein